MKHAPEMKLAELLDWLEATTDPRRLAEVDERYRRALTWEPVDRLPLVISHPMPPNPRFQPWPHREIFDEPAKMLFNELVHAFDTSIASHETVDDDLPWTIRANFGAVVIASLFGARVEQVDDNPPWVQVDETHPCTLQSLRDVDPTDFSQGWCPRVVERCEFYREALRPHPVLAKLIRVVLPDLQGPFDTLELLVGSEVFLALYDAPADVAAALHALAAAQVGFARHLAPLTTDGPDGFAHQHPTAIRGRILIRDDTSILVSPDTYREVLAPHDAFVLGELGGGGIHSCGNVGRHAPAFFAVPGTLCFDFGQAELNDMDRLYPLAQAKRIALVRVWATEQEIVTGRILDRFPTGVTLRHHAKSPADARRIMNAYRRAADRKRLQ